MERQKFKLWHSLLGTTALLAIEGALIGFWPMPGASEWIILCFALLGSVVNIYIATEVIEEVKNTSYMLILLSVVVMEFIVFFAFQYWYVLLIQPASFPTLVSDPTSLLLHSTMIFVFNPLYLPATLAGRALLLINTLAALGLVLFILQNIWQFRRR
ncbi:MAG TPA: hypothetical protein VIJ88_01745 [Candidatus Paceibacterota bacterium]